jgi:GT2 family glycosyltransferase
MTQLAPLDNTSPRVTVAITTRNRRDDVLQAIASVLSQSLKISVLILDDASTDETAVAIANHYPSVMIVRSEHRIGLIAQRNLAARIATTEFVASLDDDARFVNPHVLSQALALFDSDEVGAVAIPILNVIGGVRSKLGPWPSSEDGNWITAVFLGGAHILRRKQFLELGGYEASLFQWGEELNYCQKLFKRGLLVRVLPSLGVEHFPHPGDRHTHAKNVWIYRNA